MNTIKLIGRLATTLLCVLFFEGLITVGNAFNTAAYTNPFTWIIQSLVLCITVWFAAEWHDAYKED